MKIRTKLLALVLAAAVSVPFAFTSCDDDNAKKDVNGAVEVSGEDVVEPEYAFTKEEFEANMTEYLTASIDYKEMFGFDDEMFALFFNEGLNKGASVDAELNLDDYECVLSVAGISDPEKVRVDLSLDGEGNPMGAPIDASVYLDKEQVSVASATLLGDKALGLKFGSFDELLEKFVNSDLGVMLESPSVEELKAALEASGITDEYIDNVTTAINNYADKYAADGEYYTNMENRFYEIAEGTYGEVGEEKVTVDGVEYEAYTLESVADNDLITNAINLFADMYKENLGDCTEIINAIASYDSEAYSSYDFSGIYDEFDVAVEDLIAIFDEIDFNCTEKIYIDKVTGKYIKSDMNGAIVYDGETLTIEGTEYLIDNGVAADIIAKADDETADIKLKLTGESTETGYALVFNMDMDVDGEDYSYTELGFVVDKSTNEYELYVNVEDDTVSIAGTFEGTAEAVTFSIDSVNDGYEVIDVPYNRITVKPVADVEAHANVTDVFDLTQEEIVSLVQMFEAMA